MEVAMALYAFDGTWGREHDQGEYGKNTNVLKFARAYVGARSVIRKDGDKVQIVEDDDAMHIEGVGARHGRLGRFFGGVFGFGAGQRVKEASARVEQKFAEGDRIIDVVGFSRGAAIALDFVNHLASKGIRDPKSGQRIQPEVRFLGLWDVVAAFGLAINVGPLKFNEINIGHKLTLPKNVKHCYHALALDERRQSFRVTRVKGAYEVWFRGVHSDVGGGNENEKLSDIALRWMMRKAALVGVELDETRLVKPLDPKPNADVRPASTDLIKNAFREIPASDWVHYTLTIRKHPDCQNAPATCGVETETFEETRIVLG
jgi:uncharacterized protein (DUF2235 family)